MGEAWGEGLVSKFGMNMYTLLCLKWITRALTLLTKVCVVRAMVFPVVMHRCESWNIKKAEC